MTNNQEAENLEAMAQQCRNVYNDRNGYLQRPTLLQASILLSQLAAEKRKADAQPVSVPEGERLIAGIRLLAHKKSVVRFDSDEISESGGLGVSYSETGKDPIKAFLELINLMEDQF